MANSLYSDDSTVGRGAALVSAFTDSATTRSPSTRATSASVCQLGDALADDRVVLQRLAVALGGAHVLGEQVEALLDRART